MQISKINQNNQTYRNTSINNENGVQKRFKETSFGSLIPQETIIIKALFDKLSNKAVKTAKKAGEFIVKKSDDIIKKIDAPDNLTKK